MAEVKILVEGYVREEGDTEMVTCTTTLIRDSGKTIVVDPGMNRPMLAEALKKEGLDWRDIDYVILTHTHTDHALLTALFSNARIIDPWSIYTFDGEDTEHEDSVPETSITMMKTPGHDPSHICVIARTEDKGTVVIAGDVFWWRDGEEQKTDRESLIAREDPYMEDRAALEESRKKVLGIADWIIPGHGKMFRAER